MLTLDLLLIFDGFESAPPALTSAKGQDHYGLSACMSTIGFLGAGEVAALMTLLMQVLGVLDGFHRDFTF